MTVDVSLNISEQHGRYALRLNAEALAHLADKGGLPLDIPINSCRLALNVTIARLGPDEWLLHGLSTAVENVAESVKAECSEGVFALVDIGHRNSTMTLSGARARDLLACGCPLNLSIEAFPPGTATRTLLGKAEIVLLFLSGEHGYQIECFRSYQPYVHRYLDELMRAASVTAGDSGS